MTRASSLNTSAGEGGKPPSIWTRDFVLAAGMNLLLSAIFMSLVVTMAPYAIERLGVSEAQAGAVASAFIIGALISRPLAGRYLDIVGRRRLAIIGAAAQVIACGTYFVADTLPLLFAARIGHGLAFGIINTALTASVIALLPARRRSEGAGYFGISGVLAGAFAPIVALPVLAGPGANILFTGAVVVAFLAFVISLFLRLPTPPSHRSPQAVPLLRTLLEPKVLPVASIMLIAGAAFSGVMTYMSLYTPQIGLGPLTGTFFLVYSATVLVVRPFVGRQHDARGDNPVIYPAIIALAIGLALIGLAQGAVMLLLGAVFLAAGFGTLMTSVQAIAVTIASPARVGLATSTFFLVLDVGTGIGPIVLGLVVTAVGYSWMYVLMAGLTLLAALIYHTGHGGTERRRIGPLPSHHPGPAQAADRTSLEPSSALADGRTHQAAAPRPCATSRHQHAERPHDFGTHRPSGR